MKNLLIIVAVILTVTGVQAQQISYQWGEVLTNEKTENKITQILHTDSEGLYLLRENPITITGERKIFLERYNWSFKQEFSKSIIPVPGVAGNSFSYDKFISKGNNFYVFCDGFNKDEQKSYYGLYKLNEKGEKGDKIVLDEWTAEKWGDAARFHVAVSPDGSHIALVSVSTFTKKIPETGKVKVFNTTTWDEVFSYNINFTELSERYLNIDVNVTNAGDVFFVKRVKQEKGQHQYDLYYANKQTGKVVKKNLEKLGDKYVSYSKMMIDAKGKLAYIGCYSDKRNNSKDIQGTFFYRIDDISSGKLTENVTHLGTDITTGAMGILSGKKEEGAVMSGFAMQDVLLREDGKYYVLIEGEGISRSGEPGKEIVSIGHGGIVIMCLNEDGSQDWHQLMKKSQKENTNDSRQYASSYIYRLKGNDLYIIYNHMDLGTISTVSLIPGWKDKSGVKIKAIDEFGLNASYPAFMYSVLGDGTVQYKDETFQSIPLGEMYHRWPYSMYITPRVFFNTPDGVILLAEMPGNGGLKYQLGIMKF